MQLHEMMGLLAKETFEKGTASNPRQKQDVRKVKIRAVQMKQDIYIQLEEYTKTQVFHKNHPVGELTTVIEGLCRSYGQIQLSTADAEYTILTGKRGTTTVRRRTDGRENTGMQARVFVQEHNRKKRYILEEGRPVPYMIDLGIMTREGKIVHSMYDKYRQINRFLELIDDVVPELSMERENVILDFGCGKSYLTFAMYDLIHIQRGYPVRMIGMDLKESVIQHCNELTKKYGYDRLSFRAGNIEQFCQEKSVDMVVTLHACDTATDMALAQAVRLGAGIILSVPCCQHELNGQISSEVLSPVLDYGILKERMAALATDGLRAKYMTYAGYDTKLLEFIDMTHTPKNILLRAVYRGEPSAEQKIHLRKQIRDCETLLGVCPSIARYLSDAGIDV